MAKRRLKLMGRKEIAALVAATLLAGCSQTASTPAPAAGTTDPNSVTVFTLALQPDSVTGCIMTEAGMTRPMTLTVSNNSAGCLRMAVFTTSSIASDPMSMLAAIG